MGIPGPGGIDWGLTLLLWAALAGVVGELLRTLTARFVPLWQRAEPVERGVLDLYLGGALLYVIAAIPWGAFVTPVVVALPAVAAVGVATLLVRSLRRPGGTAALRAYLTPLLRPTYLLVILSALALFIVELSVALPIATGNTFDSSLLTLYASLLLHNHAIALSFAPYASTGLLYPQGTTVWFGDAQLLFGLPPARVALLTTPLFIGLVPLAGFAFGRRLFNSDRAGLAVALVLAWVGTGTRGFVFGSNDFVVAFPLVLLLAGQASFWWRPPLPRFGDVVGFGLLSGYSAALNPVGVEWLFLALPVAGLLTRPRFGGQWRGWFVRWGVAISTALIGIVPSLYVLVIGHSSPGFVPGATGAPAGSPTGITESQFFGFIDPFRFSSSDLGLSPIETLWIELAVLIALGLAVVLLVGRDSAIGRYLDPFRPFVAGAVSAQVFLIGICWAASTGFGPAVAFTHVTNVAELSTWLFTTCGLVAALPLALALELFVGRLRRVNSRVSIDRAPAGGATPRDPRTMAARAVVPLVVALVIVVPGVVLTPTALPPILTQLYHDFGNVTAADFALLDYAADHLPSGARVLVAPGSAGEFLPGYCANIVLLYPMVPGWSTVNASYERLVRDLPNATFGPADRVALGSLDVGYVVVTGNNTILWRAFSPGPFLADPARFPVMYHDGDAYLFAVTA